MMARSVGAARDLTTGVTLADRLELADSFVRRLVGLMGRARLAAGAGLWIAPGNGIHMWFMRQSIDAVFLGPRSVDGSRVVVAVRPGLRPWIGIVPFVRGAAGVLELPAGATSAGRVTVGDRVAIEVGGQPT